MPVQQFFLTCQINLRQHDVAAVANELAIFHQTNPFFVAEEYSVSQLFRPSIRIKNDTGN
jgi:hypothetical protein